MVHLQLAHVKNELQLAHSVGPSDAIRVSCPGKGFLLARTESRGCPVVLRCHSPFLTLGILRCDPIARGGIKFVSNFFFLKKYFWIRFFNSILFAQFVFLFSTLLHYFCEIVRRRKFVLPFVLYFIVILWNRRNLLIGILEMFVHFIFSIFNFYHKFVKEEKNNI